MAAAGGPAAVGPGALKLEPTEAKFIQSTAPTAGGYAFSYHKVTNSGKEKMALKVKCSDNRVYRLRPVFSVLEAGKDLTLTVAKHPGPDKKDKLVIQSINVKPDVADAAVVWKGRKEPPDAQVTLILSHGPPKAGGAAPPAVPTPTGSAKAKA